MTVKFFHIIVILSRLPFNEYAKTKCNLQNAV